MLRVRLLREELSVPNRRVLIRLAFDLRVGKKNQYFEVLSIVQVSWCLISSSFKPGNLAFEINCSMIFLMFRLVEKFIINTLSTISPEGGMVAD